ncbi:MAG: F0F1 ATP synthase subunit B [Rhodoferax sp.]|uniref:F0F1 ATP synthase subunit delta n=1 Tax=Rhodoferax sp. TaxID=50421 RepID=UPI0008B93B37|nr:F0F1 ATP synthase subunit delta [Rhodoferax sp.]MDP2679516.1 F0F1 ATP synthase subunit B [Rhodoferax sp.]OGB51768.1 MAG: F0F1 ATP synthase subunit B [Burkholderiales bacterium RIFOXYD12_FULL_59_19]OGB81283.1 MAG: F0F1 ATP synthase subunit B [Burkholderiales bacterium RIFOXYC12_FULL_60_6]OGB82879.1 MAG: F0F1 ATP synthase subunit B [Burkholderiales bacterium RIFOXYD2_FULL_59_8]
MLFDWFTVGAQTLNFLVLVWLMKRFLYKPILDAVDAREKRIALALAEAALKQMAAQKERDEFHQKNEDFDRQRNELLGQAKDEASAERQRLQGEARQVADTLRAKKQDALTSELQTLHEDIARRSREEVLAIAQKVLTDLAGTSLEERMCAVFTQRLRELDDAAKAGLAEVLATASNPVRVCSAFVLSAAQRAAIQSALNESFAGDIRIQFDTTPDLISGIELTANGWKLAWNIADFLASLEQRIDGLLKKQSDGQVHADASETAS